VKEVRVILADPRGAGDLWIAVNESVDQEALKLLSKEELVNLIRSCYNVIRRTKEAKEKLRNV
jgi:hypothetical protein